MKTSFFSTKKSYLPRFSRIFTERPLLFVLPGVFIGFLASFMLIQPHTSRISNPPVLPLISNKKHSTYTQSYETWKQITSQKPEYRDGFVMLAYYAKEIGKDEEAKEYLQRVLRLDPNYQIPEVFFTEK